MAYFIIILYLQIRKIQVRFMFLQKGVKLFENPVIILNIYTIINISKITYYPLNVIWENIPLKFIDKYIHECIKRPPLFNFSLNGKQWMKLYCL